MNFTTISVLIAMYLMAGTEAVPVPQVAPVADVAQQIAQQGAVLQHQVAAGVNQIANQVAFQANVAMQQAQVQQAQIAHAVNTIANQAAVGR